MALVRDFIIKRPDSLHTLLKKERNKLNLKAVERILIKFDPFRDDSTEIRKFSNLIHHKEALKSNPKCFIKTEILTDRSEETVNFKLTDGNQFIFKCANLKCLEIFKLMNQHLTPLAPKEEELNVKVPALKKISRK